MTHIYPNSIATPVASAPPSLNWIAYYVRIHSSLHLQPAPPSPLIPPALPFAKRQEFIFYNALERGMPDVYSPNLFGVEERQRPTAASPAFARFFYWFRIDSHVGDRFMVS